MFGWMKFMTKPWAFEHVSSHRGSKAPRATRQQRKRKRLLKKRTQNKNRYCRSAMWKAGTK